MKISVIIALLCCFLISQSFADVHHSAGTRAFPFLNINYDAFSVGMGGASIAVPGVANDIVNNPAGQAFRKNNGLFVSYRPIFEDIRGLSAGLSCGFENYGVVAVSVIYLSSGEFAVIEDDNGQPYTTDKIAGMHHFAGSISWAYRITDYFSTGITFRRMHENISLPDENKTAGGISCDLGVQYRFFRNRLVFGGVLKNLGTVLKSYNETDYKMPTAVEVGLSYIPQNISNLRLALDCIKRAGDFLNFHPGLELFVYQKYLALRLGFPFSTEDIRFFGTNEFTKSNANGLSVGIGVNPPIKNCETKFNFALQLKSYGLPPSILVSNSTEF